jgi:signal transduction histidine kinase
MTMNPAALAPTLRLVAKLLHLLVIGLLALTVVRAWATGDTAHPAAVTISAAVMAAIYVAGPASVRIRSDRRLAALWLAAVGVAWLVVLVWTADGVWLAFPLYFVELHLLPRRPATAAVAVTALAAGIAFAAHNDAVVLAALVGPVLGGAVAIATVAGYESLYRESEQRRRLITELRSTQADLVEVTHEAGVLAERERLAREIHDTLAQNLSSIQLLLRAAGRKLPPGADDAARLVEQARLTAQDGLDEARRFVRALTPPSLEESTLAGALERLATTTSAVQGLPTRFVLSGTPVDTEVAQEVALLRVAQSALANAVQHAGARQAVMTLSYLETEVALEVVDDGVGLSLDTETTPTAVAEANRGFGLASMRSRARSMGGTVEIESAPGEGTAIRVLLPITRHEPAPDEPAPASKRRDVL